MQLFFNSEANTLAQVLLPSPHQLLQAALLCACATQRNCQPEHCIEFLASHANACLCQQLLHLLPAAWLQQVLLLHSQVNALGRRQQLVCCWLIAKVVCVGN
jgi:hypothetical protein